MLKKRVTPPSFIAAWIYAWSLTSAVLKLYRIGIPMPVTIVLSLIAALSVFGLFYNKWTLIGLGTAVLALAAVCYFNRESLTERVGELLPTAIEVLTLKTPVPPEIRLAFAIAVSAVAAIPSMHLFGRLRGAAILGTLVGAVLFFEWTRGRRDFYPELCAACGTVTAVSAGGFARRLSPRSKTAVTARILAVTAALAVAVTMFTPRSAYSLHNIEVETFVDDYVDLLALDWGLGFRRTRTEFDLSGYGYDGLGGPVTLSTTPVFSIRASEPSLYRVAIKDVYTGDSWEVSGDTGQFRFASELAIDNRERVFRETLPAYTIENPQRFARDASVTVTVLDKGQHSELLTSGRPLSFEASNIYEFIPYYDLNGTVFSKRAVSTGGSYTVRERRLNFRGTGFTAAMLEFEAAVAADKLEGNSPDPLYAEIRERFTALPDNVPNNVREFAAVSDRFTESPYLKVLDLRSRLAEQSTYTLTPVAVPEGAEFVSWFLESREGYCTYYATALTVLARSIGIPARYAEGFTTFGLTRDSDNVYTVTGEQAHSWCEIYIEGVGWIPVDATLNYNATAAVTPPSAPAPSVELPTTPTPPPNDAPMEQEESAAEPNGFTLPQGWPVYAAVLLAGLLIAVFALLIRLLRRRMERESDAETMLLRFWRDILRMLPILGLIPRTGETPTRIAGRAGRLAYNDAEFSEVAEMVELCVYGSIVPDSTELERVASFRRGMDQEIMKILLPHRYVSTRLRWKR
ncbi:MAG: transglutaminase-like domain-containing protein [Oscillospiraceae bacterium]|jgi:transglutaminase-like putative cysteine protease|nr:transglutaminase-like domain-containing protein [Oscillospiraceae bacterium]